MARSAACRFATGARNVTTTGWATPTTWPAVGRTDATANRYGRFTAARRTSAGPVATDAAIATTATTDPKTARMLKSLLVDRSAIAIVWVSGMLELQGRVSN